MLNHSLLWTLAVILTIGVSGEQAYGLGEEKIGNQPLNEANYKPAWMPVINDEARVYFNWVNGNENFYFKGDVQQLNAALKKFAAFEEPGCEVVLLPGPDETGTFSGKNVISYTWRLQIFGGIAAHMLTLDQGDQVFPKGPTITVRVDRDFDLAKLEIPQGVTAIGPVDLSKRIADGMNKSKAKEVRGWGCGQLAAVDPGSADNLAILAEKLKDRDSWVVLNAIGAVSQFRKKAASQLPTLRDLAKSEDKNTKEAAQRAIETIEKAPEDAAAERERAAAIEKIQALLEQRNFAIAKDPKVYFKDRNAAAARLSEKERNRLRDVLTAELPGGLDVDTMYAVVVLGEIGNEETAKVLEALPMKYNVHGKINVCIDAALKQIRERAAQGDAPEKK